MAWRQSDYLGILIASALNHFAKKKQRRVQKEVKLQHA